MEKETITFETAKEFCNHRRKDKCNHAVNDICHGEQRSEMGMCSVENSHKVSVAEFCKERIKRVGKSEGLRP